MEVFAFGCKRKHPYLANIDCSASVPRIMLYPLEEKEVRCACSQSNFQYSDRNIHK